MIKRSMINLFSDKSLADLWTGEHVILPEELSKIYEDYLHKIGTYEQALSVSPSDKELIGGSTDQATISHFTHRFASSAIRIEYLTLNPKKQFNEIQSNLLKSLADGKIALLDIPCGSGASIISLLCTLIALRKKRALVSLPLELNITAGDISLKAIEIYNELLEQIRPLLDEQGIRLSWKVQRWDASSTDTTASIVDSWFRESVDSEEYLVLISAFSGATAQYFEKHKRSFQHITERLHDKPSTILWIEPKWGKSDNLFKKIISMFKQIPWFHDEGVHQATAEFKWYHPIKKKTLPKGTILVKKYSHR